MDRAILFLKCGDARRRRRRAKRVGERADGAIVTTRFTTKKRSKKSSVVAFIPGLLGLQRRRRLGATGSSTWRLLNRRRGGGRLLLGWAGFVAAFQLCFFERCSGSGHQHRMDPSRSKHMEIRNPRKSVTTEPENNFHISQSDTNRQWEGEKYTQNRKSVPVQQYTEKNSPMQK
jgi:hypothetical protein